jgi:hypothetical protein
MEGKLIPTLVNDGTSIALYLRCIIEVPQNFLIEQKDVEIVTKNSSKFYHFDVRKIDPVHPTAEIQLLPMSLDSSVNKPFIMGWIGLLRSQLFGGKFTPAMM